jgi:hypothetical protein
MLTLNGDVVAKERLGQNKLTLKHPELGKMTREELEKVMSKRTW